MNIGQRPLLPLLLSCYLAGCHAGVELNDAPQGDESQSAPVESVREEVPMTITLSSPAFQNGQPIPAKYTADGNDVSPQLRWSGVPAGTKQLALICDDPDAPTPEPWVHWLIYHIPPDLTELPEGIEKSRTPQQPAKVRQGENSFSSGALVGYRGPAPPKGHGTHHYYFKLYALDAELDLDGGLMKSDLLEQIQGHMLAQGELIGTYTR